jgi:hypothetical protein
VGLRLLVAAAAAVLLAGCEVYAVPDPLPCPGDRQGVFEFSGNQVVVPGATCFFAVPGDPAYQVVNPISFQGTINFGPVSGEAAICVSQPHALPRLGTHQSGVVQGQTVELIDVRYENRTGSVGACSCPSPQAVSDGACLCPPNSLQGCSCPVVVEERIQGALAPATAGSAQTFTGTQLVTVTPRVGPGATPCNCLVACTYSYDMAATAVGSR